MSIARYTLYPTIWFAMISHPGQSLFLGCFPMGLASKFYLAKLLIQLLTFT
jgi:hypothetical protein